MTFRQWITDALARRRDRRHIQPGELTTAQAIKGLLQKESESQPTVTETPPHPAEQPSQEPADRLIHRFPDDGPQPFYTRPILTPVVLDRSAGYDKTGQERWH